MSNALGPWGVSHRAEALYRLLLRRPDARFDTITEIFGISERERDECLAELRAVSLLTDSADGALSVTPPRRAIESLVSHESEQLQDRMAQLDSARAALMRYVPEYRPAAVEAPLAEIIPYGQWFDTLAALVDDTDGPVNTIYLTLQPELEERLDMIRFALARGQDYRLLLPMQYLDDEAVTGPLRGMMRQGVEMRFAARTVTSLSIFGTKAASTVTAPQQYYSERLVIRTPTLISIFQDYFNALWRVAVPLDRDRDSDDQILLLLAQGLKDEAIAAQLQMSLRTVRRRIADLMNELDVESRFQAGVEAVRRGWIG